MNAYEARQMADRAHDIKGMQASIEVRIGGAASVGGYEIVVKKEEMHQAIINDLKKRGYTIIGNWLVTENIIKTERLVGYKISWAL